MKKTTLSQRYLERGDIAGLLEQRRRRHGATTMTAPNPSDMPASNTITIPVPPPAAPATRTFTQADIDEAMERTRTQEKDKLYPQIEELKRQQNEALARITAFDTDLASRQKMVDDETAKAAKAAEEARTAELSFSEKLEEARSEFSGQFATLQATIEAQQATIAKEREFGELSSYRADLLQNDAEILPHLRGFVSGNTREEIDASVSQYREASNAILQEIANSQQQQRVAAPGVGITAPPAGPLDNNSGYEQFTAEGISAMTMSEYAAKRDRLLGAASQSPQNRGLLG